MRLLLSAFVSLVLTLTLGFPSGANDRACTFDDAGGPPTPKIEEKKRVPKPKKEKEKKESEQDKNKGSSCFGDCMGSVVESMLDSDDSEEEKVAKPGLAGDPHAAEFVAFRGVINPLDPAVETIEVWTRPGGNVLAAEVTTTLHRGARVEVIERRVIGTIPWYKVRSYEPTEVVGWTDYQNVTDEDAPLREVDQALPTQPVVTGEPIGEPPPPIDTQDEPTAPVEARFVPPPPTWQILGEITWDVSGREDVRSEYPHGGLRTGGRLKMCPTRSLQIGLAVTYTQAGGDPQYNYKIEYDEDEAPPDSSRDIPRDSDLDILAIELQVGQYLTTAGAPGFFTWGIGPTLFRVRERADIFYVEFEDDNPVRSGERRDEMVAWKLGADARIGLSYFIGDGALIGATMGFSFIPWDGKQEESLTLDWIESDHILLFHIGITVGYSF